MQLLVTWNKGAKISSILIYTCLDSFLSIIYTGTVTCCHASSVYRPRPTVVTISSTVLPCLFDTLQSEMSKFDRRAEAGKRASNFGN